MFENKYKTLKFQHDELMNQYNKMDKLSSSRTKSLEKKSNNDDLLREINKLHNFIDELKQQNKLLLNENKELSKLLEDSHKNNEVILN